MYTLELLHVTDQEASGGEAADIPRLSGVLNALRAEDLGNDGEADNTLTLSSGDAFLPGLFFDVSEAVFGTAGIADVQIQNALGFQAMALGNHEFDLGTDLLAGLIDGSADGDVFGEDFAGTDFPYLSSNLDFSTDDNLGPLAVDGGQAPQGGTVTSSTVIEEGGELIGVVGATTPTLATISNPGDVTIAPAEFGGVPSDADLDALAAVIQEEVDTLLADNPTMNKVILLGHMQQIAIEFGLAERLENVDIIVAGGSNTRLVDENDRLRAGDNAQGEHPTVIENAGGTDTLVVNTDANYKYVGRLVIDFDEDGNVIADSYDADISGVFATDDQGVADLNAEDLVDPDVAAIVSAIQTQIVETESNVFGISSEFLNGNRRGDDSAANPDGVRTQETNLGNLTADANLAAAKQADPDTVISLKNGGGIRASIGESFVPAGGTDEAVRTPNAPVTDADGTVVKPEGGISETDIARTLAFNNDLSLLTLTRAELVEVLEHAVADIGGGRFPQVSGLRFAVDFDQPEGARVQSAAIVDDAGTVIARLIEDGETVGDPAETFRIVTLNFLADGGDGFPFPTGPEADRVDITIEGQQTGAATFADDFSEQDALAEYLAANFATGEAAFDEADLGRGLDARVQNLAFRSDTVDAPTARDGLIPTLVATFAGEGGRNASEVVAHEDGRLYVTNGSVDRIDVFDIAAGTQTDTFDLSVIEAFDGVQSVDVKNGIVAAAVDLAPVADGDDLIPSDGVVAFFDAASGALLDTVGVGALPDSVKFTPDGTRLLVTNEGEFNSESDVTQDAPGTVSVISISGSGSEASFAEVSRFGPGDVAGIAGLIDANDLRIDPNLDAVLQHEPEFVAITPDGTTAFVSFQENNWIGEFDIASGAITDLFNAGTVDFSTGGADFLDDEVIDISAAPVRGLRMPDAMATFEIGGTTYIATANEGDGRGDAVDGGDEARVGEILDGEVPGLSFDASVDTTGLERLIVSTVDGDTDGDGDIDEITTFGGRSFTIFDTDGTVVFDSGPEFEKIIANLAPERFLDDDGETGQNRADAKGAEPEAIEIGRIGQQSFAFIGLERDSGIMVYNVSQPEDSRFVTYIDGFETGNLSPEIIEFIPEAESTSGSPQIAVSYEISGTTAVYDLGRLASDVTTEAYFEVALGRDVLLPGYDFWSDILEIGNVERIVAEAFDTSPEFQGLIDGLTDEEAIDLVFNNARDRDATDAEQAEYAPEIAEQGFDGLFFDLVNSDDAFLA